MGQDRATGVIPSIVRAFITSRMSLLLMIAALALGAASVMVTAKEEEPQIVVPMADVMVQVPGTSAEEVERLVTTPLEKLLWQIDGVEYVYSVSRRNQAMATVRFYVGEDREDSLIKLHNAITKNRDLVPNIVQGWSVKPVEIDDVPIIMLTLHSKYYSDYELRRMAEELYHRLAEVEDISRADVVSGRKREIRVELLPDQLAGYSLSPLEVAKALEGADISLNAGQVAKANRSYTVVADSFLRSAAEVKNLVVGVFKGRPVYVSDVAMVRDGPEEALSYSRIGFGDLYLQSLGRDTGYSSPAVTMALAKKKGTNAVTVAQNILDRLDELKAEILPEDVQVTVTRNFGETAQAKVNDLLESLILAIITVVALLAITLGWREALVVAMAVPVSFSLALFVNYLLGYTINRVTLFALILSLGLVVDDPITNVDNIQRHMFMGKKSPLEAALTGVNEVLPPVLMSTLAIIVCFLPLFFITGMMGPYMAPMAANVPLTVTFSTLCALTIVPWMAYGLLRKQAEGKAQAPSDNVPQGLLKFYKKLVGPFLDSRTKRWILGGVILVLLIGSISLAALRQVPLKMLPFDNKNELQLVIDMDEGTPLEQTDRVVRKFEDYLRTVPEVENFVSFVGEPSPMDFNGMVRHYYWRGSGNLADIRVNLADKKKRAAQSHAIHLRLRRDLEKIARSNNATLKIVESPPGPPVISTITAEVYTSPGTGLYMLGEGVSHIEEIMSKEPGVADIDSSMEADRDMYVFVLDKEKAALHGVSAMDVARTLAMALSGDKPARVHAPGERQPLAVKLVLPRNKRSSVSWLSQIQVRTKDEYLVPLGEIGTVEKRPEDQVIMHKNLKRVAYVYAESVGRAPAESILDMQSRLKTNPMPPGTRVDWAGEGEWKITLDVFRDLGIAFAAALMGIYILLVMETNSFFMPLLIMSAIPLTLLGIMPGFWLLNILTGRVVDVFNDPVFFTATSMIGMIALGGIVIRNSLVLIDFIREALSRGETFRDAVIESGAIRLRPIVLTALTTALGAWPITFDPIFSGLAWALIFGLFASTVFTLVVIPVSYYAVYKGKVEAGKGAA